MIRDICGKMSCNDNFISRMDQYKAPEIESVEQAERLLDKTIEQIADEIDLIGTTYYLTEPCESVQYHSIASVLLAVARKFLVRCHLTDVVSASILDVKEKKLGYDRSKTIKIVSQSGEIICFIYAETEVCDVSPKIKNGRSQGLKIVSVNAGGNTLAELFDKADVKDAAVMSLIKDYYFSMMDKQILRVKSLFSSEEQNLGDIKQTAMRICEAADRLRTEYEKLNV